jgi:hypothetical protein
MFVIKKFYFVTYREFNKARVFVADKLFENGLIFAG